MDNPQITTDPIAQGLIRGADELIREIDEATTAFQAKTSVIIAEADKIADQLDADQLDKELREEELVMVEEADDVLFGYLEDKA